MEKEMLDKILAAHKLWIESSCTQGEKADLREVDLREADLSEADLIGAAAAK